MRFTDPIAALATVPGRSALAVIRVSGQGTFDTVARVIEGFVVEPARTARLAVFQAADGQPVDRGLYLTYPRPHSYTGQDLVELTCHGGLLVPAQVLASLHAAGARPAAPGEFTRRAVLTGKMDLVQAEAVGDLIAATAPAQGRSALHRIEGGLSSRLNALRDGLIELQAMLAYAVDFPEEDDGAIPPERLRTLRARLEKDVAALLATAPMGKRLHEGALVVLAGRPNAGKSSLFNALLGLERALVTEVPGTTRDTIEAGVEMNGWPVRLADTAGLWEAPTRLDQLGVEVSRRYLEAADLVLLCVEAGRPLGADEQQIVSERPTVVARTKLDLLPYAGEGVGVSAVSGAGLDSLRNAMVGRLFPPAGRSYASLEPMLTHERHRTALGRALEALRQTTAQLGDDGEAVLAAHHVRTAILAVDELIGVVDVEDVLDRVFRTFCVGK